VSIKIKVTHVVYETDYEPYHCWTLEGWSTGHDTERAIMARAQECIDSLSAEGIAAEIEIVNRHVPYPEKYI
jgi:hypothetical protein